MDDVLISVEVVYANAAQQALIRIYVPSGSTVQQAIVASNVLQQFPEIDLNTHKVGLFSQLCPLDRVLEAEDRVEIYRPLIHDPKESRRNRAIKK